MMNRKGVSPVIATILLVMVVIAIAIIVILWLRGFLPDAVTKFGDENIELACGKVDLRVDLIGETLSISNRGNVPIEKVRLKLVKDGSYQYATAKDGDGKDISVKQGKTVNAEVDINGLKKIIVVPVLKGRTESGDYTTHICEESDGEEVTV